MIRSTRFIAAALLALTFIVGGLAGMALEEGLGLDWFDFLDEDNLSDEGRLLGGLALSADQEERIDEILESQEERLEEYWEVRIPEMQAIIAESYERIREVLTPEQRAIFDARIAVEGIRVPMEPD